MKENENWRLVHIRILICYTIIEAGLITEALFLGWSKAALLLVVIGIIGSWTLHITELLTPDLRLGIYFAIGMLAFFFYGVHETSFFDLAPVIIVVILIMSGTNNHIYVRLCAIVYFFTMFYAILFVTGDEVTFDALNITRTILHFVLVLIADQAVKSMIWERVKLRDSMDEKISELEEINHQTENFLVNVSHELRTPINAITGFSSVLLNQEKDESKRKNILSIQKAGRRLFDQIESILDYTEIDMGKMKLNRNTYMISSVLNDVITLTRETYKDSASEIIFKADPEIPEKLIGDEKKIKKILRHLIDNAVKFTPKGEVLVEISALKKSYGINLYIKVTDTGIGIKEEEIKNLSHRFYQLDSERNRNTSGLGLGLPICYGMVSAMGGFVKIDSNEGTGTTVSVSIPQEVAESEPFMSEAYLTELNKEDSFDTRKLYCPNVKALIVDDEPMNLMVAEGIFQEYGMEVKTSDSGEKAIAVFMQEDFDLIFLDHMMPGMDGVEVLKRLRKIEEEKNKKTVIIAFTANAVSGARTMFLEQGFDEFISKPIEKTELDRVLKRVLPSDAIKYQEVRPTSEIDNTNESDDWLKKSESAGINTKLGLSYCQGDEDFYEEILASFVSDAEQKKENMKKYSADEDWKNYRILAHSVKSTAKTIGAEELSDMAKALETAAKESDVAYLKLHGEELIEKYESLVQSISDILGIENKGIDK